ncbi:carbon-nitrogen hydrolase [Wenyingzhuangia sp. 2_MG-2023]|uniref:carbon-nitrogen hydrolase n=1 Tax=Wenyingzhuangia sp. 2_MG-2023 TaxID=3062639 RepID=UPI0026E1A1CF|nr:carbon-nitrogen hydrolase [Wenyingzhuangia sp. 2_MG-2023]MDO6739194.1 carbon-nitrogen hydrolase [Wenyingzhuangia sp. 2_MG-2023]
MSKLNVGIVQQSCTTDKQDNINKSIAGIKQCAKDGAELVVLQELHTGIYFCQAEEVEMFEWAEPFPGSSYNQFSAIAKELNIVLVTSLFEKRAPGIYHNTAVVFEKDGTEAGRYRKMHIPDDPAYYEKFYFTPGDLGFTPIQTSVGKLGVLICWDQWYPEAARLMAMAGAEVLIYPTAIGYESTDTDAEKARQRDAWMISQRGHSVANGLPVISVNRVGFEKDWTSVTNGIEFWGTSFITGPQGEVLWEGTQKDEINKVITIDKQKTEDVRRIWPFFRDRRIDAYGDITKRYID